jgi:hypothetical protein
MASADQSARAGRRSGRCGRPRSHPCRSRGTDQPVAKIVPNTQPAFARPSGELRLGRHATRGDVPAASTPSREGCLDEAREASEVGLQVLRSSRLPGTQQLRTSVFQDGPCVPLLLGANCQVAKARAWNGFESSAECESPRTPSRACVTNDGRGDAVYLTERSMQLLSEAFFRPAFPVRLPIGPST